MIKKTLILVVILIGFVGGAVGGDLLHANKSEEKTETSGSHDGAKPDEGAGDAGHASGDTVANGSDHGAAAAGHADLDWFRFPNQFFVPIIRNGRPTAIMVLTLSVEMPASARPRIEAQENRLRDALLAALMVEANTGGFDGNFTTETSLQRLRNSLLAAGQKAGGADVTRILIEDIGRQEQ